MMRYSNENIKEKIKKKIIINNNNIIVIKNLTNEDFCQKTNSLY